MIRPHDLVILPPKLTTAIFYHIILSTNFVDQVHSSFHKISGRHTQTHRHRHTHIHRHTHTQTDTDRQTDRQTDTHTHTHTPEAGADIQRGFRLFGKISL